MKTPVSNVRLMDCMSGMAEYPDKYFERRHSRELQIGKAGEYLVCADLILKGFVSFPSEQGLPYDVLVDIGHRILKVQVKTTMSPRVVPQRLKETRCYIFNIKKCGKGNLKRYTEKEIDLFALVCIDSKRIGYVLPSEMPETANFRVDELRGSYYDEKGVADYNKSIKLSKEGESKSRIAEIIGIDISQVYRYLENGFKPHKTTARYFSSIERNNEWFFQNF